MILSCPKFPLLLPEAPYMKIAAVLIQALFIYVVVCLFVASFKRIPLTDNMGAVKTLGFWGACVLIMFLDMVALGASKAKGPGVVMASAVAGIILCVLTYGLIFGPR